MKKTMSRRREDVLTITPTISVKEPVVGAKKETTFTEGYWPENASQPVIDAKGKVNLLQLSTALGDVCEEISCALDCANAPLVSMCASLE